MANSELQHSAEQFFTYLRDERQLSPHTLSNYRRDLASLISYCQDQKIHAPGRIAHQCPVAWQLDDGLA